MATNFEKQYKEIFRENIKREGGAEILKYLDTTDFFKAPASTKYHSNHTGGLCEHSVRVYERFVKMCEAEYGKDYVTKNAESLTVIALLHDICKINCYKTEMRNQKVGGEWVQKPYFAFEDPLPYGHGEKSVYIASGFMKLTREEAMSINWHMGAFDARNLDGKYTIANAFHLFPLALIFHASDLLTSYLDEKITK
jgi:hypothetical protein